MPYLKEIDREELLQSIRQPETEAEQESNCEPVEAAIWVAVEGVARAS